MNSSPIVYDYSVEKKTFFVGTLLQFLFDGTDTVAVIADQDGLFTTRPIGTIMLPSAFEKTVKGEQQPNDKITEIFEGKPAAQAKI